MSERCVRNSVADVGKEPILGLVQLLEALGLPLGLFLLPGQLLRSRLDRRLQRLLSFAEPIGAPPVGPQHQSEEADPNQQLEPPRLVEMGQHGEAERGVERVPRLPVDRGLHLEAVGPGGEARKLGGAAPVGRGPGLPVQPVPERKVVGVAEGGGRKVERLGRAVSAEAGDAEGHRIGNGKRRGVRIDGRHPLHRREPQPAPLVLGHGGMHGAVALPCGHSVVRPKHLRVEAVPAPVGHGFHLGAGHTEDAVVGGHPERTPWGFANRVDRAGREAVLNCDGHKALALESRNAPAVGPDPDRAVVGLVDVADVFVRDPVVTVKPLERPLLVPREPTGPGSNPHRTLLPAMDREHQRRHAIRRKDPLDRVVSMPKEPVPARNPHGACRVSVQRGPIPEGTTVGPPYRLKLLIPTAGNSVFRADPESPRSVVLDTVNLRRRKPLRGPVAGPSRVRIRAEALRGGPHPDGAPPVREHPLRTEAGAHLLADGPDQPRTEPHHPAPAGAHPPLTGLVPLKGMDQSVRHRRRVRLPDGAPRDA